MRLAGWGLVGAGIGAGLGAQGSRSLEEQLKLLDAPAAEAPGEPSAAVEPAVDQGPLAGGAVVGTLLGGAVGVGLARLAGRGAVPKAIAAMGRGTPPPEAGAAPVGQPLPRPPGGGGGAEVPDALGRRAMQLLKRAHEVVNIKERRPFADKIEVLQGAKALGGVLSSLSPEEVLHLQEVNRQARAKSEANGTDFAHEAIKVMFDENAMKEHFDRTHNELAKDKSFLMRLNSESYVPSEYVISTKPEAMARAQLGMLYGPQMNLSPEDRDVVDLMSTAWRYRNGLFGDDILRPEYLMNGRDMMVDGSASHDDLKKKVDEALEELGYSYRMEIPEWIKKHDPKPYVDYYYKHPDGIKEREAESEAIRAELRRSGIIQ